MLLLSPLLGLSCETMGARDVEIHDPSVSPRAVLHWNRLFAGETPFSDLRLDQLGADMRDRPPTLIQAGGLECLVLACERYGAAMTAAGSTCEVQVWPGLTHAFPGVGSKKQPEAKAAVTYGARFVAGLIG